jgi:hypothetical protein
MRSRIAHRSRGGTGVAGPPGGDGTGMEYGRSLSGSRVAVFATLAAIVDLFEVLRQDVSREGLRPGIRAYLHDDTIP